MREVPLEPYLESKARVTYVGLNGIFQDDVERRIEFLCRFPEPDDEITFAWPEDGPNSFIYFDGLWVLAYSLENDASVLVVSSLTPTSWI